MSLFVSPLREALDESESVSEGRAGDKGDERPNYFNELEVHIF